MGKAISGLNERYDDNFLDFNRYSCCCRSCHVTQGAWAIGCCELLIMAYHLVNMAAVSIREGATTHKASVALTLAGIMIGINVVGCLIYGLLMKKPIFIIPHLIMQAVGIAVLLSLLGMTIVSLTCDTKFLLNIIDFVDVGRLQEASHPGYLSVEAKQFLELIQYFVLVIALFVFASALLIALWFFRVVHKALQYLLDLQNIAETPIRGRNSVSFVKEIR